MNIVIGSGFINKVVFYFGIAIRFFKQNRLINVIGCDQNTDAKKISKIFVINLDRQPKRWSQIVREFKRLRSDDNKPLDHYLVRVPAVDGKFIKTDGFSSEVVEKMYYLKDHFSVDPDPRLAYLVRTKNIKVSLSASEIAVALSHIKVWKKIVTEKVPYSLIVEDDIYMNSDFAEIFDNSWYELPVDSQNKKSFDILYLSYKEVDSGAERIRYSKYLFKPIRGYWWLSGYVLSYEGAKKLLSSLPVFGPVDMWINLQFKTLSVYHSAKSIISQRNDIKSDNTYSIMPVLSRAGIRHNEVDTANNILDKKPIFAIGLNKTGTTSLHFALTRLGYKSCHWVSDEFSEATANLIGNKLPLPFDAYTDVQSVVNKYQDLEQQYPNAGFILTTRDVGDWIASRSRHVIRNRIENTKGATHEWVDINVDDWIIEREAHHDAVLNYFKDKPNKLLIMDICSGDGWDKLCEFLGVPKPDVIFPHVDPLIKLESLARSVKQRIPISPRNSIALDHDTHPWIKRPNSIDNYVGDKEKIVGFGNRTGTFSHILYDKFDEASHYNWDLLDNSFPYNQVIFDPKNVRPSAKSGLQISVERNTNPHGKKYTSGSLRSKKEFQYGRFKIEMKPIRYDGLISAFFLYRIDPWQEIDIEFMGDDTSHMLVNVYYNHGDEGTMENHGTAGTPVLIDLGFDASLEFHTYAIEWDPNEIRWFVDDSLVHVRTSGYPTPIPHLPLQVFINLWVPGNSKLAEEFYYTEDNKQLEIKSIELSTWIDDESVMLNMSSPQK